MRTRNFIIALLILFPCILFSQHKRDTSNVIVENVQLEGTVEEVPPPVAKLKEEYKSISAWLTFMCNHDKPAKPIAEFKFGMFESSDGYILFLTGQNRYNENQNRSSVRIEFQPSHMYFKLPESEYKNLTREQLLEKLTGQFKEFANTETFKNSFFTKADKVIFEPKYKIIWSK